MQTLKQLIKKHPTYANTDAGAKRWELLTKLVAGGSQINGSLRKELLQNPDRRPLEILEARAKNSTYVNVIGSTIFRIVAQLFQEPAQFEGNDDDFWTEFLANTAFILDGDDDAKAGFSLGLKDAAMAALTCGQAIAEISTSVTGQAQSLKDQRELGELNPYVVLLPRTAMWDWDNSARGFEFVKLHRYKVERKSWDSDSIPVHNFTVYARDGDRVTISQYEVRPNPVNDSYKTYIEKPESFDLEKISQTAALITVVQVGNVLYENQEVFNLNGKYDFPIKTLTLPANLCVGDQLFDLAKENFNIRAGIDWKLQSVLFSMPVLTLPVNEDDASEVIAKNQKFGDGYMLVLPNGSTITTLDLGGGGISTAKDFLEKNNTDILNQLQQMATSAAASASGLGRSADKTREDRKPEVIMLEVIGTYIRQFADQILSCCAIARGEDTDWNVNGFNNYLGEGVGELLNDVELLLKNGINTPTLRKQSMEKAAIAFGKKYSFDPDAIDGFTFTRTTTTGTTQWTYKRH